jgi:hypothetical protein
MSVAMHEAGARHESATVCVGVPGAYSQLQPANAPLGPSPEVPVRSTLVSVNHT